MFIKKLPEELQRKILFYAMIHPTATLIRNITSHYQIEEFNYCYNIETHKIESISLYELLVLCDILKNNFSYDYIHD